MIQCAKICVGKRKYELIASKWCANRKAKNRDGNRTWVLTSIINREWKVMEKESKNGKRQQIKGQCKCETVCTNTVGCAIFQVVFFFTAAGLVVWLFDGNLCEMLIRSCMDAHKAYFNKWSYDRRCYTYLCYNWFSCSCCLIRFVPPFVLLVLNIAGCNQHNICCILVHQCARWNLLESISSGIVWIIKEECAHIYFLCFILNCFITSNKG